MKRAPAPLLLLAFLVGCSPSEPPAETASTSAPAATSSTAPSPPPAATPGEGRVILAPGATFPLPESWAPEPPSSQMRLAQARIPGPGGEGQLAVFFFGAGSGGGVEANLNRWAGQMEADAAPQRGSFVLGTWKVSWIEVAGTLKPSTMGGGPTEPQPGSILLGAVVEGEGGPWFFKATGPAATIEAERESFMNLLKSGRPRS